MKYQNIVKCILVCFLILLSQPAFADSDGKEASFDDFSKFLIDEWANKIEYTMAESSTLSPIFFLFLVMSDGGEPNYIETTKSFAIKLIASENDWDHLPEYWQLRAQLERDNGLDWIDDIPPIYGGPFSNKIYGKQNIEMLKKSFEIDPSNADVKWYLGRLEHEIKFPDRPDFNDPVDTEFEKNYYKSLMQFNADAGALDPENAFYAFYEAAYHHRLGNKDATINAITRAGSCNYFDSPRLFPSSFAMEHIVLFESKYAPFSKLTPGGKFYWYHNFYADNDSTPNFIRIKNMYKGMIADSHSKEDWRDTLNILNRAACVLGKCESYDIFTPMVAMVMVQLCLEEAYVQAREIGDEDFQSAVIVAMEKTKIPRIISYSTAVNDESMDRFHHSIFVDFMNRSLGKFYLKEADVAIACFTESNFLPPKLEMLNRWRVHKKQIKPIFEDLETFDYTNPSKWYETWHEKMFPEVYITEADQGEVLK